MKRLILFFMFGCVLHQVMGQEFEPGPQAQGYLHDKNTIVDYAPAVSQALMWMDVFTMVVRIGLRAAWGRQVACPLPPRRAHQL